MLTKLILENVKGESFMAQKVTMLENGTAFYPATISEMILDADTKLFSAQQGKELSDNVKKNTDGIESINNMNTAWSDWSTNGMTLLNGAKIYSGDYDYPMFRTRLINGNKQVQFRFRITNLLNGSNTPYVGFPSVLQPGNTYQTGISQPSSYGKTASWVIERENTIKLHNITDAEFDASYWYPFLITLEVN